jgi:hypothetical protein
VTIYLEDVCVYSCTLEEHLDHMRGVLQGFKEEGLNLRLKRCVFGLQKMECLGYIVSASKTSVSSDKVEVVSDWQVPTTPKEARRLVQFYNFYAKFIQYLSDFTAPLTDLLRKSQPRRVTMSRTGLKAFKTLKLWLITAPCEILIPEVSSDAMFTVATNASAVGTGTVLLQDQGRGLQLDAY